MATLAVNDIIRVVMYTKFNPQPQDGLMIHYFKVTAITGAPTTTGFANNFFSQTTTRTVSLLS